MAAAAEQVGIVYRPKGYFARDIAYLTHLNDGNNFVMSPYSVDLALQTLHSISIGKTKNHLEDCFTKLPIEYCQVKSDSIKVGNMIMVESSIYKPSDLGQITSVTLFEKDKLIEAVINANKFVSTITNGMIDKIIENGDIDGLTRVIILNAIYFKSTWKQSFNPEITYEKEFTNGLKTRPMIAMTSTKEIVLYYEDANLKAIEKEYIDSTIIMGFVLPHKHDLKITEQHLNSLKFNKQELERLQIPKFRIESSFELSSTLAKMFESPNMLSDCDTHYTSHLNVSRIIHKAVIEVDEFGTKAAAATAMMLGCAIKKKYEFVADHPFMYYIKHVPTQTMLFVGYYQ